MATTQNTFERHAGRSRQTIGQSSRAIDSHDAPADDSLTCDNLAVAALTRHAHDRARIALFWQGADGRQETCTFFDLERMSNQVANALAAVGVEQGERVFTLLGRTPALYAALPGALKLGAAIGALFTDFGPEAIRQRLADAGACVVITDTANMSKLASICATLPELKHIFVVQESPHSQASPILSQAASPTGDASRLLFDPTHVQVHDFHQAVDAASPDFAPVAVAPDDTCFFIYTSGTTGLPKGVVHRHAIAARLAETATEVLALEPDDLYWCTADPGWVTGLCYGIFAPWLLGRPVFAYEGEFDARAWTEVFERHQVTVCYTTPTMLRLLMRESEDLFVNRRLALRRIYSVGEPLNAEVISWVERVLKAQVFDTYWQTETGTQIIANRPGVAVRRGSMGTAVAGVVAGIVDERGHELPPDTVGDIAIRPALSSLFKGYWKFPEATRLCFRAGWYITRDRGRRDADGYFWFIARDDDVITCEAQRVGPFEVESALLAHRAVAESAVIGVHDAVTTERVKAYIVLRDGYAGTKELAREIAAYVREQLSPVARPREIEFCDELPKTRSGKIQRARLRRQHEQGDGGRAHLIDWN